MPKSVEDRIEDLLDQLKDDTLTPQEIEQINRKLEILDRRKN